MIQPSYDTNLRKPSIPSGGYIAILVLCLLMTILVCR